jgi:hypothetical protein
MLTELEIQADMEATAFAVENGFVVVQQTENERLLDALERCFEAEQNLPEILAKAPKPKNPADTVEVEALEWQREVIEKQIRRGARAARERKALLESLRTEEQWDEEWNRCAAGVEGMKRWFRYWAWALDPRAHDLPMMPFVPFGIYEDDESDFQWRYIVWLDHTTFIERKSGIVEKSRDMGATLGWTLWGTYNWLFRDSFTALLIARREEDIDSKKEPDTLFEKVREALRLHPPQLLPETFDMQRDARSHMNLANPETRSVLTGAAPTENIARGKRRTAVLKDESASWMFEGEPQATSLGHVSNSCFDVSSVQGRYNNFARKAHTPGANKFVMDWRDHPWKDERWYNSLPFGHVTDIMTAAQIAQEVDRNYDASQPGKVFVDWSEIYTCVEWEEIVAYFTRKGYGDRFYHVDGTPMLPYDWNFSKMQDKGETIGHPRMTLYCARPPEGWPLSDSVFFFIEHMAPTAADLGTVVAELKHRERELHIEERRAQKSLISHEAKKDRNVYLKQFGWNWTAWDTDYESGIANIRLWIKPKDTHLPNPIRPALMGRATMYLVCRKGQATLFYDEQNKKHSVTPAVDSYGFARLRAEMPSYHYKPEEAGKPVKDQRPERYFDDAIACVRGIAVLWGPKPKEKTPEEKLREKLAAEMVDPEARRQMDEAARDAALLSEGIWLEEFRQAERTGGEDLPGGIAPLRVERKIPRRS